MDTQTLIEAQRDVIAASGGLAKALGLKPKAEETTPADPAKKKEEEKKDEKEDTLEARVAKLEAWRAALEEEEKDKEETAKALAAARDAMVAATATLNAAAERLRDPAWAQAFSAGLPPTAKQTGEVAQAQATVDADKKALDAYLALPPGSKAAADFYAANAEAIARAINR